MKLSRNFRHAGLSVGLALLMSVASTQTALGQDDPASTNGDIQAPQAVGSTAAAQPHSETYSPEEVRNAATKFFGSSSEGLAKAIEKAFADYGQPNAYITGTEGGGAIVVGRSEEHTSELQSLMRISYAVFCL